MVNQKLLASENWFSTSSDSVWQGWGLFHSYGLILATTNIITETRTYAASTYSQIWIASGFIKENSRAGWLVGTCKRTSSIVSNRIINRIESKIYCTLEHEYFTELELSLDLFLFFLFITKSCNFWKILKALCMHLDALHIFIFLLVFIYFHLFHTYHKCINIRNLVIICSAVTYLPDSKSITLYHNFQLIVSLRDLR